MRKSRNKIRTVQTTNKKGETVANKPLKEKDIEQQEIEKEDDKIIDSSSSKIKEKSDKKISKKSKKSSDDSLFGRFKTGLFEVISENQNFVTIFMVSFLLLTGYVLVNNPTQAWIPAVFSVVVFGLVLLFLKARIVIKVIGTVFILLVVSSSVYQVGFFLNPFSTGGILWFLSFYIGFFLSLSYSYFRVKGTSRWNALLISILSGAIFSYIASILTLNPTIAAIVNLVVFISVFFLTYNKGRNSRYAQRRMPVNVVNEDLTKKLLDEANKADWLFTSSVKGNEGHYLAWNKKAFMLYPIFMDEPFKPIQKGKQIGLGYKGKSINPWMIDLVFNKTPLLTRKGTEIMLVLLDMDNKNGKEAKTILVQIPDSKKTIPVGVMPAGQLFSNKERSSILKSINKNYSSFVDDLTGRQHTDLVSSFKNNSNIVSQTVSTSIEEETDEDETKTD